MRSPGKLEFFILRFRNYQDVTVQEYKLTLMYTFACSSSSQHSHIISCGLQTCPLGLCVYRSTFPFLLFADSEKLYEDLGIYYVVGQAVAVKS